ncbi:MAG: hypothetical protein ACQEVA_03280 [Myxococcota bacterium]
MAKRTQFEVLLDVRESKRDEVEAALADALAELERRRDFVRRKRTALEGARSDVEAHQSRRDALLDAESFQPRELASLDRHAEVLRDRVRDQRDALERALASVEKQERRCEAARGELNEAQKELEAVRKHYEKQLAKKEIVEKRKQQAKNDEIASRRWWEENR